MQIYSSFRVQVFQGFMQNIVRKCTGCSGSNNRRFQNITWDRKQKILHNEVCVHMTSYISMLWSWLNVFQFFFFGGGGVLHHKTNGKWHIKHYWVMHTMGGLHYMSLSIHQQIVKLWQDFLFSVAIHPLNMEIVHDITVPLPESVWKHLLTRWVH